MKKSKIITDYYDKELLLDPEKREYLGWESRESQFRRFRVLTDYISLHGKKVLDVGCGLGHLVDHLEEQNIEADYTGVDLLPSMVKEASSRHGSRPFIQGDLFQKDLFGKKEFHVLYCSGLFNLNTGNNFDFLLEGVEKFIGLSREAVVFNLLHRDSPGKEDKFYYFYPDQVIREIEKISDEIHSIQLVEHYLNNDFTLFLGLKDGPLCKNTN